MNRELVPDSTMRFCTVAVFTIGGLRLPVEP